MNIKDKGSLNTHLLRYMAVLILCSIMLGLIIMPKCYASEPIKVLFRLEEMQFESPPVLKNGRVLVPMRKIFEAEGAKISWDGNSKTVTAETENRKITLTVGDPKARLSTDTEGIKASREVLLEVPAEIIDGYTFVPLRFISESLGNRVQWDEASKSVHIEESLKLGFFPESGKATRTIQGNNYTIYYESAAARELSKTLEMDIEARISALCGISRQIAILTPVRAGISSGDNSDLLVNVSYFDDMDDPYEKKLFMVFTKEQGKYAEQFCQNTWRGKGDDIGYQLVDTDSDGKSEVLLNVVRSSMAHYESTAMVLKYINHKVAGVFSQSMSKSSSSTPFYYDNKLTFLQNTADKNRYDIQLQINLGFDQDIYKFRLENGNPEIPEEKRKGGSKTFIFKFDGEKYSPDKPLPDYEN